MALLCKICNRNTAEPEPGEVRAIERYVCSVCGESFFVHNHVLIEAASSEPKTFYVCRYFPSNEESNAKAYIRLKQLLKKFKPHRPGNLEQQYETHASVWLLGTFAEDKLALFTGEANAVGLQIEATLDAAA